MADIEAGRLADSIDDTISALNGVSKACTDIEEATDLPGAFCIVLGKVKLVTDTLAKAESHIRTSDQSAEARQTIWKDVEDCMEKAQNLRTVFRRVVPKADIARPERYRLAVNDLGKEGRVEILMKGILEDVYHLAGKCEVVDKVQAQELVDAIEQMSTIPPSLPERGPGTSINNYGSGTLNANSGEGTQNNNNGSGKQYIGEKQYFGRDE